MAYKLEVDDDRFLVVAKPPLDSGGDLIASGSIVPGCVLSKAGWGALVVRDGLRFNVV